MKNSRITVFLLLIASLLLAAHASAKSNIAIGQNVYEKMLEAQVKVEEKNYSQAIALLDLILENEKLNNYEIAQTWSLKGNVYFHQERYDQALESFKTVVSFKDLPAGFVQISLRTIAQLSFMQGDYASALQYAKKLVSLTEIPDAEAHMLLAQVYFKMDKYPDAQQHALKAIDIERAKGGIIRENWLLVLNAIYYSTNNYSKMIEVLNELIDLYPKDTYVKNLAAIYGVKEETKKQLLLMEPLYDAGKLTSESELLNLANLLILHKVPYKGAKIIEQGFQQGFIERSKRNLELLAQSWQLAADDEQSAVYLAEAASLAKKGDLYGRLAQTYMNLYRWKDAEKALETAIKLGDLDREGDTHLLLGMVRYYQKDYRSARKAFREASEFDKTHPLAEQWIVYLEQEKAKEDAAL